MVYNLCTALSSAWLQVNVGSMSDPTEIPGLAHFVEHMLFYSSERYPEEDAYMKFIVRPSWTLQCAPECSLECTLFTPSTFLSLLGLEAVSFNTTDTFYLA